MKNLIKSIGFGPFIGLCVTLSVFSFLVVDCSGGSTNTLEAQINGKEIRPAWTEYYTEMVDKPDGAGGTQRVAVAKTRYYPAKYILYFTDEKDTDRSISIGPSRFHRLKEGDFIKLRGRYGKWTGWRYMEYPMN